VIILNIFLYKQHWFLILTIHEELMVEVALKSMEYNIFLFKYKVEESQQCIREKEKVSF